MNKDKSQKDGCQIYCKKCRRQISKEWSSTLDGFIKKILCDLNNYCKNAFKRIIQIIKKNSFKRIRL